MEIHESKDKIRVRAHQLWEQAGRPDGQDLEHWLQAEKEFLLNSAATAPLAAEANHEFSGGDSERKPAQKTSAENSAPKNPRKSSGRNKSK
jgi:hypothetical protein